MERQSALHRCHLEAHAQLKSFSGWQLPAWYTEPSSELDEVRASVGISDASYLSKLDLRGPAGDFPPPARLWKLTPAHALVTSPLPIAFVASPSVTDVTSIYSAILLAGPKSREVLQKLTTLNVRESAMPEGAARQTRLAHVNATILRSDEAFRFSHLEHPRCRGACVGSIAARRRAPIRDGGPAAVDGVWS